MSGVKNLANFMPAITYSNSACNSSIIIQASLGAVGEVIAGIELVNFFTYDLILMVQKTMPTRAAGTGQP